MLYSFGTTLVAQQTLCGQFGQNFDPTIAPSIGTDQYSVTSSSSLGVSGWYNERVEINGTFKINSNFSISQCTLKMGSNAKILIEGSNTFSSWSSYYFHCGTDFWGGIIFDYGSTSQSTIYGNHIEDADKAVTIRSGGSQAGIVGNKFNRNFIGIYAWAIPVNALVALNLFDCSSNLNTGSSATSGYAGIHLESCPSASIGLITNDAPNYFRRQQFGIRLYNTTAFVGLSDFYKNDIGIWGNYSVVTVQGHSTGLRTNFRLNRKDIETLRSNLYVFYCSMDSCHTNNITASLNNMLQRVHISENLINMTYQPSPDANKHGIYLDRSAGGNDEVYRNIIERNHLTINDFGQQVRKGIFVQGQSNASDFMRIEENTIDVFKGGHHSNPSSYIEVVVKSSDDFHIFDNLLRGYNTFETGKSRWGFHLHDGNSDIEGNFLGDNDIFGDGFFDGGCCAVHCVNSGPWTICNNWTDHTYRGLHFMGVCGQSTVGGNIINDHDFYALVLGSTYYGTGLLIQGDSSDNGFIGDQVCQGNEWTIPNYPSAARAAQLLGGAGGWPVNIPSGTTINNNNFLVDNLMDSVQAPPDRDPANGWFIPGQCFTSVPICIPNEEEQEPEINEHEIGVIANFPQPMTSPNSEEWEVTYQLMKKLMRYPQLVATSTAITSFRSAYNESSAGQFARFDSMLNAALLVATTHQASMNDLEEAIMDKQAEIKILDATVTDLSNPGNTFFTERAALLAQLGEISNQRAAIQAQILSAREPLLLACEQYNSVLSENQPYEQNQKSLNALSIKHARSIEFGESDYNILHTIAQQCYATAWRTRNRAISMLPPGEAAQYWRENPDFSDCGERQQHSQTAGEIPSFKLSPNPASEYVRISFEKPFSGNLSVSDLSGKIVLIIPDILEKQAIDISTGSLPQGVYVLSGDGVPVNNKFVILR